MRLLDFDDGYTSSSAPSTVGLDILAVSGTRAAPNSIVAGTGITSGSTSRVIFVEGSGGAVNISANPQITVGTTVGQMLIIVGRSDSNTVTLEHGDGLVLNGSCVLSADSIITLIWDGTNFVEVNRNDI